MRPLSAAPHGCEWPTDTATFLTGAYVFGKQTPPAESIDVILKDGSIGLFIHIKNDTPWLMQACAGTSRRGALTMSRAIETLRESVEANNACINNDADDDDGQEGNADEQGDAVVDPMALVTSGGGRRTRKRVSWNTSSRVEAR